MASTHFITANIAKVIKEIASMSFLHQFIFELK